MPLIYRAMFRDDGTPRLGPTKNTLGVRVGNDPQDDLASENGDVSPGTGGMSVAPNWRNLPAHRIPRRLRGRCTKATGNNNLACWRMGEGPFEDGALTDKLALLVDRIDHGTVQPSVKMSLVEYGNALAATQDQWSIHEE